MPKLIAFYAVIFVVFIFVGVGLAGFTGLGVEKAGSLTSCLGAIITMFLEEFLKFQKRN